MSILTTPLPDCIILEGRQYKLNTDFKVWLEFEEIMQSKTIAPAVKKALICDLCFKESPPDCGAAFEAMWEFYRGGQETTHQGSKKPLISFSQDAEYIYSAFYTQYGIDLTTKKMHWYKFRALFSGLSEDNLIVKIMHYRSVDLSSIKDKKQKAFYRKMKSTYRLDRGDADIAQGLEGLFKAGGAQDE